MYHETQNSALTSASQEKTERYQPSTKPFALEKVELENNPRLDYHALYWWERCGYVLAALLNEASYSSEAQYRHLKFFQNITPFLGPAYTSEARQWKSFMTDDHSPIELSWDWQGGNKPPKIRFSVEPIGIDGGTDLDPDNKIAATIFREFLSRILPQPGIDWLRHFQERLSGDAAQGSIEGHQSKEFYAFDLNETSVVGKAYFFPGFLAKAMKCSNFDVILSSIQAAPHSSPEKLVGLGVFEEYLKDPLTPPIELEMLGIDLVEPASSRFKIYFRNRNTSYRSIKDTMSLGNRLQNYDLARGLERLRMIYYALLDRPLDPISDNAMLPMINHRTGGILYNVEFRYGSMKPKVKVYLPVRHYVQSENTILSVFQGHMCSSTNASGAKYTAGYTRAIKTSFLPELLARRSGLHTYVGCSIEAGGELRVVSYFNPRQATFQAMLPITPNM